MMRKLPTAVALSGLIVLAACKPAAEPAMRATQEPPSPAPAPSVADTALLPAPVPPAVPARADGPPAPPPTPPPLTPEEKGEKGARAVLLTWARALENGRFQEAWAQYLNPKSGPEAFARWWRRYRTMTVAVPNGEMDAGAGSLYYTAPTTITGTTQDGTPFRLQGDVVLRRVNDVDGATPEQMRWHIATADLKAVPVP